MSQQFASSGRGGAGNFVDSSRSPKLAAEDLETPTLKTSMVTTGRGGTGNMARNKDPDETRAMQDVKACVFLPLELSSPSLMFEDLCCEIFRTDRLVCSVLRRPSQGATLVGRGGTGNVFMAESEEAETAEKTLNEPAVADEKQQQQQQQPQQEQEMQPPQPPLGTAKKAGDENGLAAKGRQWLLGKKE